MHKDKLARLEHSTGRPIADLVSDALADAGGSVRKAAGMLGVTASALWYWLYKNGYSVEVKTQVELRKTGS